MNVKGTELGWEYKGSKEPSNLTIWDGGGLFRGERSTLAKGTEVGSLLFSESVVNTSYYQAPKLEQGLQRKMRPDPRGQPAGSLVPSPS